MIIFITGGARSGKSRFAERYAQHLGKEGIYVATSQVWDEEMAQRVHLHQQQRDEQSFAWTTVEEPYELAERLEQCCTLNKVILVDCLTLWLSNWMLKQESTSSSEVDLILKRKLEQLRNVLHLYQTQGRLILVSNEVGDGIVPEYPLGRKFRDWSGRMNQAVAEMSDKAFLVTAGIPIDLKQLQFRFSENDRES